MFLYTKRGYYLVQNRYKNYQGTGSLNFQILLARLLGALLHLSGVSLGVLGGRGSAVIEIPKPFFSAPSQVVELFALAPADKPPAG